MLAKSFRLSKKDISRLFQKGKRFRESFFLVRFYPNRASHDRFAVIVPKKIAFKSTQRSRLKRMIMLALQKLPKNNLNCLDIAVTLQQLPNNESELDGAIAQALGKIKVEK